GVVHEWSDIDLFIVKDTPKRPIDRILEVTQLVRPRVGIDFFVYTPAEVSMCLTEGISFIQNILNQGKVLYEKGNPGMGKDRPRRP
ncbi:MAG: nucleotidyltransferase domain-containing protein, partial [Atribacterota bacterium]|nr:nucleotidyltransferase domain-containing protein [Atribacterota bacterium]